MRTTTCLSSVTCSEALTSLVNSQYQSKKGVRRTPFFRKSLQKGACTIKTRNRLLSFAFALALLFALSVPAGAASPAAQARFSASVRTVDISCAGTDADLFRVAVDLSPGSGTPGIASYVVTVRWDPTVLELARTPQSYRNTGCCFTDAYSDGWTMIPDGDLTTVNVSMAAQGQLTVTSGSAVNLSRSSGTLFSVCFRPRKSGVATTVTVTPGSATVSPENALSSASGAVRVASERFALRLNLIAPSGVNGDVSDDGMVDATDYMMVKRHVLRTFRLTGEHLRLADVNRSGDVNAMDYMMIKRHVLGTFRLP